ncbi:MAG: hypothetical protein R3C18_06310 [Planctomycetaceae bacterium]
MRSPQLLLRCVALCLVVLLFHQFEGNSQIRADDVDPVTIPAAGWEREQLLVCVANIDALLSNPRHQNYNALRISRSLENAEGPTLDVLKRECVMVRHVGGITYIRGVRFITRDDLPHDALSQFEYIMYGDDLISLHRAGAATTVRFQEGVAGPFPRFDSLDIVMMQTALPNRLNRVPLMTTIHDARFRILSDNVPRISTELPRIQSSPNESDELPESEDGDVEVLLSPEQPWLPVLVRRTAAPRAADYFESGAYTRFFYDRSNPDEPFVTRILNETPLKPEAHGVYLSDVRFELVDAKDATIPKLQIAETMNLWQEFDGTRWIKVEPADVPAKFQALTEVISDVASGKLWNADDDPILAIRDRLEQRNEVPINELPPVAGVHMPVPEVLLNVAQTDPQQPQANRTRIVGLFVMALGVVLLALFGWFRIWQSIAANSESASE